MANGLSNRFLRVLATDISQAQLDLATFRPNIDYRCVAAEEIDIPPNSVDLVTVGCAVHWFDRDVFYRVAQRALNPRGIIAVWSNGWPYTGYSRIDEALCELKEQLLRDYWPNNSDLYLNGYRDLEFPFSEIQPPQFSMEIAKDLDELKGFLSTWCPSVRYFEEQAEDPVAKIAEQLDAAWIDAQPAMPLRIPIHLRVGSANFVDEVE